MKHFLDVENAPDLRVAMQENLERMDAYTDAVSRWPLPFASEAAVVNGSYVGGVYEWPFNIFLKQATIICSAPGGAAISFTLEIDGVATGKVLTVADGATTADPLDLSDLPVLTPNQTIRWKCTASPAFDNTASQIQIVTYFDPLPLFAS